MPMLVPNEGSTISSDQLKRMRELSLQGRGMLPFGDDILAQLYFDPARVRTYRGKEGMFGRAMGGGSLYDLATDQYALGKYAGDPNHDRLLTLTEFNQPPEGMMGYRPTEDQWRIEAPVLINETPGRDQRMVTLPHELRHTALDFLREEFPEEDDLFFHHLTGDARADEEIMNRLFDLKNSKTEEQEKQALWGVQNILDRHNIPSSEENAWVLLSEEEDRLNRIESLAKKSERYKWLKGTE